MPSKVVVRVDLTQVVFPTKIILKFSWSKLRNSRKRIHCSNKRSKTGSIKIRY